MSRGLLALFLALATPAHTAVALERLGDREALRDPVRSFGCRLVFPNFRGALLNRSRG